MTSIGFSFDSLENLRASLNTLYLFVAATDVDNTKLEADKIESHVRLIIAKMDDVSINSIARERD